ncbi:MAG: pyridoxamine 5'-phosphate oxidase family protein [Ilumatobacter sp.]
MGAESTGDDATSVDDAAPYVERLTVPECWELLRVSPVGRIALPGDDEIEVFPVNFAVDGGTIVFRTAVGTKRTLIGDGVSCTFEVDHVAARAQLVWSIVLKGTATPLLRHDDLLDSLDLEVATWQVGHKPTYVRLTPHSISGRRFGV